MSYHLDFTDLIEYDTTKPGIMLEIELKVVGKSEKLAAKLDTGSSASSTRCLPRPWPPASCSAAIS